MDWVILILISALFLSLRTIFTKKLLLKNDTVPILFLISLFSMVLMIFFKDMISFDLSIQTYGLLLLKSIIIAVSWYLIFQAYKNLDISIVAPLRNLSPLFLIFISFLILGESVTMLNYIGIFLLIVSAYGLELKSVHHFLEPLKLFKSRFFLYIILSLIGNSFSAVLDKFLIKQTNYYTIMFFFYLFLSFIFAIMMVRLKETYEIKTLMKKGNMLIVLLITISTIFADISYFTAVALPGTLIVLIIPLRRMSTLISTIAGGRFFHEKNILYKGAVCLVMIFGVFLIAL